VALPPRIGRYRVLRLLGRGAMGVVYRARDDGLERDVALKVMAMRDATAEARERFLREARSVARLQHPNIVVIYELGEHDGAPFMAMEMLEGLDLQRAVAAGLRPDPRVTLPIVMQVLAGLGHAHEHGIVHRDVKPSNVFLPRGRPAKVMDFGVARLAAGTTAAGTMVGTPNYMSPEQVRTGLVDGRSDLFSAGLILYELVTGEKVYRADNVVSLLYKIAHEDPALAELPAGAQWERVRKVVLRALARQPEDRYPDAHSMSDDVARALEDFGGAAPGPPSWDETVLLERRGEEPPAAPAPEPRMRPAAAAEGPASPAAEPSRRVAFAALGAAVAALIMGAVLFVTLRPPAPTEAPPAPGPIASGAASTAPALPSPSIPAASPSAAPPSPTAASPSPSPSDVVPSPRPAAGSLPAAGKDGGETRPGADAARLERANDLFDRGRYAAALAEARAVLRRSPGNAEARALAEDAEVAIVIEGRIKKAREALRKGDRETALQEARAGLAVAPSDARLLELFKEATR
jgi:eukaryotic-like serine/threonine-protein kinase